MSGLQSLEAPPQFAMYMYHGNDPYDACSQHNGKIYDLSNRSNRPVPPSEDLGYTNTHPHCKCTWVPITGKKFEWTPDKPTDEESTRLNSVNRKVGQRARHHTLHTVFQDGELSQRTRGTNPIHEMTPCETKGIKEFFENADESWPPKIEGYQGWDGATPIPNDTGYSPASREWKDADMPHRLKMNNREYNDSDISNIYGLVTGSGAIPSESNIEKLPVEKINWYGLAADFHVEEPLEGYEGWTGYLRIPPDVFDSQVDNAQINPNIFKDLLPNRLGMDGPLFRETVQSLRNEFEFLSPEYVEQLKAVQGDGRWLLIRAAEETITDHRAEGEMYPRFLKGSELAAMARTGITRGADVNHLGKFFRTDSFVTDAEFNERLKQLQFIVHENDQAILEAITNGTIGAVSINGGPPRMKTIEPCAIGTCEVPHGVVLGESDDIAFTYVVTSPNGFQWKGNHLPPAKPGISNTKIEFL